MDRYKIDKTYTCTDKHTYTHIYMHIREKKLSVIFTSTTHQHQTCAGLEISPDFGTGIGTEFQDGVRDRD